MNSGLFPKTFFLKLMIAQKAEMKLKFNDKVYDILKWLCLIALPALSVLYSALAGVWGWPYAQEVATTINAVVAFVGALIGISTASYNKANGAGK